MTIKSKTCTKCHETKPLDEFYNRKISKDNKSSHCKECDYELCRKYRREHQEEGKEYNKKYYIEHKDEMRQKYGHISMYENKLCPAYLGVVIAERLCRHLFKDIKVMPNNNTGYDIICNRGKKIDVKSGCITFSDKNKKYSRWLFTINNNEVADFFILVAFDNLIDLNPLYLWMIPGKELNDQGKASVSHSTIHKWSQWERDIEDAQICCNEMKQQEK